MAVTLKDIAKQVGVQASTVSRVLNGKNTKIKVASETKRRIFTAVKELGYHPNASARSLVTSRTKHLGLIMSDKVTDGFSNTFYSKYIEGVEQACRACGYGLNISLYNLSCIKSFVLSEGIGQRSVDGLILLGYAQAEVLKEFQAFSIPCVFLGDDVEEEHTVATVASDLIGGILKAIEYLAWHGHQRIAMTNIAYRRDCDSVHLHEQLIAKDSVAKNVNFSVLDLLGKVCGDFRDGPLLMKYWLDLPEDERPTAIIASDQAHTSLLREMRKVGLRCPEDISLISYVNTRLCEFADPPLTAIRQNVIQLADVAVKMLLKHVQLEVPLTAGDSRVNFPCELIVRDSCTQLI